MIERPVLLTEDARAVLTSAATGAARTNRPRWLIYLGAAFFIAALLYTGYVLIRWSAARVQLDARRTQLSAVKVEAEKLVAIADADKALGGDRANPDPRMADKITKSATDLGLVIATVTEGEDQRTNPSKAVKRKRYDFKLSNQPADQLFTWLKKAVTELPGVQINRIDVTPGDGTEGRPGWNLNVTFTRWERVS